ncbi:DUF2804 domain-containing protein [Brevibacillus laterosporus]|uniref:DUF2804 domain-containing protein n=1 Tax=Brevibacillus laterosporus TaxID=1465 RepID=UPI000EAC8F4B|nr:DUF2804 domain-containing protein [Brevibacillus laterosporus]AYK05952.1 DUF2804 domain-containing protein [Brevibacillus laterosporus]MDF9410288.1 DUF2804 domain-containing protein [Brevibacillus laterosporus]
MAFPAHIEKEITEHTILCDRRGNLRPEAIGWSRYPLHDCQIPGHLGRKKKWNFWFIVNNQVIITVAVCHLDYIGVAFFHLIDLQSGQKVEQTVKVPFARGIYLPDSVHGDVHFQHKHLQISFMSQQTTTMIVVDGMNREGMPFSIEISISETAEALHMVIPWSNRRFQYTKKQPGRAVEGKVRIGSKHYNLTQETTSASLDFGRGVWPYITKWNWMTCSFQWRGSWCGCNLGAGWTDGTGMTENGLLIQQRAEKIAEPIQFEYDKTSPMKPWCISTIGSDRVQLKFTPIYYQEKREDYLALSTHLQQYIGKYSGTLQTKNSEIIRIDNVWGICEDQQARW